MLGVKVGAATVFGVLLDKEQRIQVAFDRDIVNEERYGCSDGAAPGYTKVRTVRIIHDFLPYAGHAPQVAVI